MSEAGAWCSVPAVDEFLVAGGLSFSFSREPETQQVRIRGNKLQINLNADGIPKKLHVEIVNLQGKVVRLLFDGIVASSIVQIPFEGKDDLESGLYIGRVVVDGRLIRIPVVVSK